jgi:hypothetical protein
MNLDELAPVEIRTRVRSARTSTRTPMRWPGTEYSERATSTCSLNFSG